MRDVHKGDQVRWNSHGSEATGNVEKKITEDTEEAGRKVRASKDDPQYLVKSEAKSVGVTSGGQKKSSSGGAESVGHDSGEKIVAILAKKKGDLDDDDFAHMRKVVGYVKRHRAQKPKQEDVEDSRWRYSLMNWGHDPLKN